MMIIYVSFKDIKVCNDAWQKGCYSKVKIKFVMLLTQKCGHKNGEYNRKTGEVD